MSRRMTWFALPACHGTRAETTSTSTKRAVEALPALLHRRVRRRVGLAQGRDAAPHLVAELLGDEIERGAPDDLILALRPEQPQHRGVDEDDDRVDVDELRVGAELDQAAIALLALEPRAGGVRGLLLARLDLVEEAVDRCAERLDLALARIHAGAHGVVALAPGLEGALQPPHRALDEHAPDRVGRGERDEEAGEREGEALAGRLVERREGGLDRHARADEDLLRRRGRQIAHDAPRAVRSRHLERARLLGPQEPPVLLRHLLAGEAALRGLVEQDAAVAVGDHDVGAVDEAALLQPLAQPAEVEPGDHGAAELVLLRVGNGDRQHGRLGAAERRERPDREALAAEHVAEEGRRRIAPLVARRIGRAGDLALDVEDGDRREMRHAALQRPQIARAGRPVRLHHREPVRDRAQEVLDALEDALDLGVGLRARCAAPIRGSRRRGRGAGRARNAPG